MPRFTRILFALSLLALTAVLPVHAQDGGGLPEDQQAIMDQLRQAIAAANEYTSFVTTGTGTTGTDQILTLPDQELTSDQYTQLTRTTAFTHDADGAANAQSTFELETTAKGFGQVTPVTTTIHAEARLVSGAVYVSAEGEASEGGDPPLLPDGWVQLTYADEWPALSMLGLDRLLENPTDPDLFDPTFYALLDHASEVWSDTRDRSRPQQIGIRVAGEDLADALVAIAEAGGTPDEAMLDFYRAVNDGMWEITVELDDAGQITRMRTEGFMFWEDYDLTALQPSAPAGSVFDQIYNNESELTLSEINAPREPVEAPPL